MINVERSHTFERIKGSGIGRTGRRGYERGWRKEREGGNNVIIS